MFHRKHILLSLIVINILLSGIITKSLSQDTNTVKYFPLKVGNIWVYAIGLSGTYCMRTDKRRIKVVDTIILNSKKYFLFKDTTIFFSGVPGGMCPSGGSFLFDTLRIDSNNGNIYKYSYQGCQFLNHEITLDNLKAKLNDSIFINCGLDAWYTCTDTSFQVIFGQSRQVKAFNHAQPPESYWGRKYSKGIGQSHYVFYAVYGASAATLIGCVLDGILYGDTSFITGIKQISNKIPDQYSLSQNYPNPFNPVTKIKFSLPSSSKGGAQDVRLIIYDILGREVTSLFPPPGGRQEGLQPGTYEVEWDGTNYPSGVYFYKLITADYTETRKMVLVK